MLTLQQLQQMQRDLAAKAARTSRAAHEHRTPPSGGREHRTPGGGLHTAIDPAHPGMVWVNDHWERANPLDPGHQALLATQGKPYDPAVAQQADPADPKLAALAAQGYQGGDPQAYDNASGGSGLAALAAMAQPPPGPAYYDPTQDPGNYDADGNYYDPAGGAAYGYGAAYGGDDYDPVAALHDQMRYGSGNPADPIAQLHDQMHTRSAGELLGAAVTQIDMTPDRQLQVSICIDGRCYSSQADLGPLLDGITAELARWHVEQHQDPDVTMAQTAQATEALVTSAGQVLLGKLCAEHVLLSGQRLLVGGWWDDVKGTVNKYAGDIKSAASVVAGAAAGALLGPEAAPFAAKVADAAIGAVSGDSSKAKALAQATVDQAKQAALANPDVAKAVGIAHQAAADTATAYHVAATVDAAKAGSVKAKFDLAELHTAASMGDPSAQNAVAVAAHVDAAAGGGKALDSGRTSKPGSAAGIAAGLGAAGLLAALLL